MDDVKWIKLYVDIFTNEKVLIIDQMEQSDSILIIWIKLLSLAGKLNNSGSFQMNNGKIYSRSMIANAINRNTDFVNRAIDIFLEYGMLEMDIESSLLYISNWEKYQSEDKLKEIKERNRERVARFREKKRNELEQNNHVEDKTTYDEKIKLKNRLVEAFDEFWERYPRKVGKLKAFKWWMSKKPSNALLINIYKALEEVKKTKQWQTRDYIPHPVTWLNQERWEDVIENEDKVYKYQEKNESLPNIDVVTLFNRLYGKIKEK